MRNCKFHTFLLIYSLLQILTPSFAFSLLRINAIYSSVAVVRTRVTTTELGNSADPIATQNTPITREDKNGKLITVGSIVRVAVDNLKAYQVSANGVGKFNELKEFVPGTVDGGRATNCLILPAGIRGVVTKLYDKESSLSANFPVQVKFSPGAYLDEGYDPPVPFVMHFGIREIEAV